MKYEEKWEVIEPLGEGGQGKVYLVNNGTEDKDIMEEIMKSSRGFLAILNSMG